MGFWIAMTGCSLILPVIMLMVGVFWRKNPPEEVNRVYGYRTAMAMKNQDTWAFAQAYCSKVWWRVGWGMLPLSVLSMLLVFGKSNGTVGITILIVEAVQCAALMLSILPTEKALKKNFDKDGNLKSGIVRKK